VSHHKQYASFIPKNQALKPNQIYFGDVGVLKGRSRRVGKGKADAWRKLSSHQLPALQPGISGRLGHHHAAIRDTAHLQSLSDCPEAARTFETAFL